MNILMIDNYDSYTYNIYQILAKITKNNPVVIKNDEVDLNFIQNNKFDCVIISPGPGNPLNPSDFGICKDVLLEVDLPILSICLGHQGLAAVYGGFVKQADEIMHGRLSEIYHNESELFEGINQGSKVVRYHSLIVEDNLPSCLEKICWTNDNTIMGIKHKTKPIWGVQFHPESILTEQGTKIIENFIQIVYKHKASNDEFKLIWEETDYCDSSQLFEMEFKDTYYPFWLDSSRVIENTSRYSYIGNATGTHAKVVKYILESNEINEFSQKSSRIIKQDIYEYLNQELKKYQMNTEYPFEFTGGFVGYLGYELKKIGEVENLKKSSEPDAYFIFADRYIVFDHLLQKTYICSLIKDQSEKLMVNQWFNEIKSTITMINTDSEKSYQKEQSYQKNLSDEEIFSGISFDADKAQYISDLNAVQDYLRQGDSYEVNYTSRMYYNRIENIFDVYKKLREINAAPYSAFIDFDELQILSSSPEKFVEIDSQKNVITKPIKGTIQRSTNPEEDLKLKRTLKESEKDIAENLMVVDLLRNDLGKVCEVGTVTVPKLMDIESFETVHQMVTTVIGKLDKKRSEIECIKSLFPGGSMTGAPKKRTMEIIDLLEKSARGIYSGALGFISLNGNVNLNIVIRTIIQNNDGISIGAGGGITIKSIPEDEYAEMMLKSKALIKAIKLVEESKIII
ncbi:aminodeoxychorismate synthase component I [Bacillus cereus]|nr:aminodeoxychorismate synthase component I [Bacillus cereus]